MVNLLNADNDQIHKQSFPLTYKWSDTGNCTPHRRTHKHRNGGEKDRAYFNGLSCCQNVWYALATDSSGIAGSQHACACGYMHASRRTNTHTCIHSLTKTRKEDRQEGEALTESNTQRVIEEMSHKTCLKVLVLNPEKALTYGYIGQKCSY